MERDVQTALVLLVMPNTPSFTSKGKVIKINVLG
jgi:hypothetical protein